MTREKRTQGFTATELRLHPCHYRPAQRPGQNHSLLDPGPLSGTTSAVRDPCAALQCTLVLAAGETREVVVMLGAAADEAQAKAYVARYTLGPIAGGRG